MSLRSSSREKSRRPDQPHGKDTPTDSMPSTSERHLTMSVFDIQQEMASDFPPLPSSGSDNGGTAIFSGLSSTANPLMLTRPPTPPVPDVTVTDVPTSNNVTSQATEINNLLSQVPEHDLLALLREHKLQKSSYSSIAQQPAPVASMHVAPSTSSRPKNHEHMYYSSNTDSASVTSLQRNIERQHQRNLDQRNLHLQQDITGKGLSLEPPILPIPLIPIETKNLIRVRRINRTST